MIKKIREYLTPKNYLISLYELGQVEIVTLLCPDGELLTTAFDKDNSIPWYVSFAQSAYLEAVDFYS